MSWSDLCDLTLSFAQKFGGKQISFDKTVPVYDLVKKVMDEMMDDITKIGIDPLEK